MAEGLAVARSLQELINRNRGKWGEVEIREFKEETDRARMLVNMPAVLGAVKSGEALWRLMYLLSKTASQNMQGTPSKLPTSDGQSMPKLWAEMTAAFQKDLSGQTMSSTVKTIEFGDLPDASGPLPSWTRNGPD